jgi:PAS domain S-box-containing protein
MVAMPNSWVQRYFDYADTIMIALSSDEAVADLNKKCCEILGCSREEVLGKNWFDAFVPEPVRENARRLFHEMLKGSLRHVHSEYPVVRKQGGESIINWHNILASDETGNTIGTLSSGTDVTEQRQAERPMREMENRLQTTLDGMLEGCQIIDYDWRYAYINESAAKQGRHTKKELLGHTMMEMYPGIENTELFSYLRDCMSKRIPHQMENEFVFPDGSKGWFELRIEPAPEGILILSMDITKRKELEEELNRYRFRLEQVVAERTSECAKINENLIQEIEEHKKVAEGLMLRAMILDSAGVAIFLVNSKGDFVYVNEAACKTYGYSHDEFLNMNSRQLVRHREVAVAESHLKEALDTGQVQFETVHIRKDGSLISVNVGYSPVKTPHGQFIVIVVRTVTN